MYDPSLGRWNHIDPLAEDYYSATPYNYVMNQPTQAIDPDGMACMGCGKGGENYTPPEIDGQALYIGGQSGGVPGCEQCSGMLLGEVTITANRLFDYVPESDNTSREHRIVQRWSYSERLYYNAINGDQHAIDILNAIDPALTVSVLFNGYRDKSQERFFSFWFPVVTAPVGFIGGGVTYSSYLTQPLVRGSAVAVDLSNPIAVYAARATGEYYSVAFEMTLPKHLYPGVNASRHFTAANRAMLSTLDDVTMKNLNIVMKTRPNGSIIMNRSPHNWVWHHDIGKGVMQLVPKATQHTPGSIFWKTLHPEGRGGMSRWGGGY